MAWSGALVCIKIKLKNFIVPETAGGCGVVPFLSVKYFFCQHVEPSVPRCAFDLIEVPRVVSEHCNAYSVRSVPSVNRHKKTRVMRVSGILYLYQPI
ncbi:TPA: hypothetical protein F6U33_03195 [Citrobacter freundii]|nr:hypothetical protein MC62_018475 [Citrobacter freundii]NFV63178.1 hypothetical protein [Citrobacter freundii]RVR61452.1 hypothetical protein EOL25_12480 [Citrobacter freundii]TBV93021.1 hypothetical protein E0E99_15600 [Citrobacter freundii]TBW02809.1 hypothetical protein E0F20_12940 [Citrobacter freundii]